MSSDRPRVVLKRGKARPIWAGHPWIYSGAIASSEGAPATGGLVDVVDERGNVLGAGDFNGSSRIAVRMLGALEDGATEADWVRARVVAARDARVAMGLPSDDTNAYRLINSDGDRLPGVTVDVLGDLASVQLTSPAALRRLPLLLDALEESNVVVQVPKDAARLEGMEPGDRPGRGDLEAPVRVTEHGIVWTLKAGKGQKTGFYTDQRDNRAAVRRMAAGRHVLDCYTYVGGFALNAAAGGAASVVGVDSSGPAVSVATKTAGVNALDATFVKEDSLRYMRSLDEQRRFDLVVLDPPKLAHRRHAIDDAYRKYKVINATGIARVKSGGTLVTCSCSGMVDEPMFLRMLTDAAQQAGMRLVLQRVSGPGADHQTPLACPEARYLTVVFATAHAV